MCEPHDAVLAVAGANFSALIGREGTRQEPDWTE
jgi:hypothetical protein